VVKPVKLYEIPNGVSAGYDAFLAKVDAAARSQLSFQVSGVISSLDVREGMRVEKDQVLASLDPTDYQLAVEASQAQYDLAQTHFIRNKQLFARKLISADVYDQSETAFKAASANLEEAKTDLRYTRITAPFTGIVSAKFVQAHQLVSAKTPILNIVNNDELDITVSIPVPYVDSVGVEVLKQRDSAVIFDIHSAITIPAKYKEISIQPESDTNSYSMTVTIQRPYRMNILTGMTGQVLIANQRKSGLLHLPEDAWVNKSGNQAQLWRFNPQQGTVESVMVELDPSGAVLHGLKPGDLVVVAGAKDLSEGQTVRAWVREGGI
jgi:RND family efflux transporter MFP subunit